MVNLNACLNPGPWMKKRHDRSSVRRLKQALIFDTANIYSGGSSEEITGKALKEMARRDEIVVATKTFFPWRNSPNTGFLSRKAIFQSIDDSLMRLGMDYVDLFQIHRFDHSTPVEETMETLHDLVKSGKVRYIGASSMEAWRFAKCSILQSVTAGPDLLRCNRNTTCFTGKKSARCCPCVKTRALE
jgi:aryl-alcohol dehydrogenase-like predicted oxidoreductase